MLQSKNSPYAISWRNLFHRGGVWMKRIRKTYHRANLLYRFRPSFGNGTDQKSVSASRVVSKGCQDKQVIAKYIGYSCLEIAITELEYLLALIFVISICLIEQESVFIPVEETACMACTGRCQQSHCKKNYRLATSFSGLILYDGKIVIYKYHVLHWLTTWFYLHMISFFVLFRT